MNGDPVTCAEAFERGRVDCLRGVAWVGLHVWAPEGIREAYLDGWMERDRRERRVEARRAVAEWTSLH